MYISFLNPLFLWAIPLTGLPILFHLLSRKRLQHILFSETKFIHLAIQRSVQLYRLRQYLLLLLRCLAILLLTLVFARPTIRLVSASGGTAGDTAIYIVLLLDNSYSVGYTESGHTRAQTIKNIASKLLTKFKRGERVVILSFSDKIQTLSKDFVSEPNLLSSALDKYVLSGRKTRLQPALEESYKLLNPIQSRNKIIVVISDMAEHGWKDVKEEEINYFDSNVKLVFIDVTKTKSENYALKNVSVKPLTVNDPEPLKIGVINYGVKHYPQLPVKIVIMPTANVLNQGFINLNANGETEKELIINFNQSGKYSAYAQLKEDNLAFDDQYYLVADVLPVRHIVAIDGDPGFAPVQSELYYLKTALNPKTRTGSFLINTINVREWQKNVTENVPVIILANVESNAENFLDENVEFLRRYLSLGGNLIIGLGDKTNPGNYNSALESILPAKIGSLSDKEVVISSYNVQHPVFDIYIQDEPPEFSKVKFNKHFILEPKLNTKNLFYLSDNTPLIVEGSPVSRGGKVILYASTFDRNWTNFPTKPVYLPFWQQMIQYLSQEDKSRVWYTYAGEKTRISALEKISEIVVQNKEGKNLNAAWIEEKEFKGWELPEVESSGIYSVSFNSSETGVNKGYLVVNPNIISGESDLTPVSKSILKSVLPHSITTYLVYEENLENKFIQLIYGKETSQSLTILAFCILILESLLANRFFVKRKK